MFDQRTDIKCSLLSEESSSGVKAFTSSHLFFFSIILQLGNCSLFLQSFEFRLLLNVQTRLPTADMSYFSVQWSTKTLWKIYFEKNDTLAFWHVFSFGCLFIDCMHWVTVCVNESATSFDVCCGCASRTPGPSSFMFRSKALEVDTPWGLKHCTVHSQSTCVTAPPLIGTDWFELTKMKYSAPTPKLYECSHSVIPEL